MAIAMVAAGCQPTQPDVGRYSTTAASSAPVNEFRLPRDRRILIASVPGQPACAVDLLLERLGSLGIAVELPRDLVGLDALSSHQRQVSPATGGTPAGIDDAIAVVVIVDALEGPGGGWRPMEVMDLKSAHRRSDVGLAVYDGRSRGIVWSSLVRERRVLECEDAELLSMIRTIVARIS
jgi:hypothetical protein